MIPNETRVLCLGRQNEEEIIFLELWLPGTWAEPNCQVIHPPFPAKMWSPGVHLLLREELESLQGCETGGKKKDLMKQSLG